MGSRIGTGSLTKAPYDKKLRSKGKYKSLDPKDVKLEDFEILGTDMEMVQYVRLCSGEDLRNQKIIDKLYCKYEHRNQPFYRYDFLKMYIISIMNKTLFLLLKP